MLTDWAEGQWGTPSYRCLGMVPSMQSTWRMELQTEEQADIYRYGHQAKEQSGLTL